MMLLPEYFLVLLLLLAIDIALLVDSVKVRAGKGEPHAVRFHLQNRDLELAERTPLLEVLVRRARDGFGYLLVDIIGVSVT